jgi:hypothetical protein
VTIRWRRGLGALTLIVGLGVLSIVPAANLFHRASSGHRILVDFKQTMSPGGLVALRENFGVIRDFGNQFVDQTVPDLQRELKLDRTGMDRLLATSFPAVWKGVEAIPPALAFVGPVIPKIEAIGSDFQSVDDIPGLGLPVASVSWLVLLLGAGVVIVGAAAVVRPSRLTVAGVATAGLLMVVVPLALNLPGKFAAGARTVTVGRVALSQHAATAAQATTVVIDNLVHEVKHSMIPALATRLGESPAAFSTALAARYPAVGRGLAHWDQIRPGGYALAAAQQDSVQPFRDLDGLPFRTLPWLVIAPGALLALLGLIGLWVGRARWQPPLRPPTPARERATIGEPDAPAIAAGARASAVSATGSPSSSEGAGTRVAHHTIRHQEE